MKNSFLTKIYGNEIVGKCVFDLIRYKLCWKTWFQGKLFVSVKIFVCGHCGQFSMRKIILIELEIFHQLDLTMHQLHIFYDVAVTRHKHVSIQSEKFPKYVLLMQNSKYLFRIWFNISQQSQPFHHRKS